MATEKGTNGAAKAKETVKTFKAVMLGQRDEFYIQMIYRGQLNRKEISKLCDCTTSALRQNPALKELLETLEDGLRDKGVLPPLSAAGKAKKQNSGSKLYDSSGKQGSVDAVRIMQLEQQVAELQAQVEELSRYEEMAKVVAEMGLIPR
ncbi:VPA1267 family protein [Vibrio sp. 1751]|uniref:VPA1267 family protein n=1 Tax=Vibrio TaxID=662 RepID=UPI00215BA1BC|nr:MULTISPECIES: VPA1267 family protein [Vibrio]MCR9642252.1 VPA1267 family protein [Vibrio alginolyticus]MDW2099132.1 VPA1267 family protein [Vibrio sp. 1751]MDW2244408.1 VPA1267 family protein [Vibrio sp. 1287]